MQRCGAETSTPEEPLGLLLARTGQLVAARLDAVGRKRRHGEVLRYLRRAGSTSQQELIAGLRVDPSVLVGVLNELERDGMVQRVRDPADRRRHIVAISARGSAKLAEVELLLGGIESELFADLDCNERESLRRMLNAIQVTHRATAARLAPP